MTTHTPIAAASTPAGMPPTYGTSSRTIEDPVHRRLFQEANGLLASTESGREVAEFLDSGEVKVRIFDDAEYNRRFPGSGASFQPAFSTFNAPERALTPKPYAATVLAHEGQHAIDAGSKGSFILKTFGAMGGSVTDAVGAATRLENPMTGWIDGFTGRNNETEVNAYRRQAQVAIELGLNQGRWAHGQNPDGSLRSDDEIRQSLATDPLYRLSSGKRLLFGGAMGTLGTMVGAGAASFAIGKLAPNSYLASHAWPLYAAGAALTGAAILGDQLESRSLEATGDGGNSIAAETFEHVHEANRAE